MSSNRLELHEKLVEVLGSRNVYFQPPKNIQMKYPAIVYSLSGIDPKHANDKVYLLKHAYDVTVIDKDPDSEIPDRIAHFPLCRFSRKFESDNLNQTVFKLYY